MLGKVMLGSFHVILLVVWSSTLIWYMFDVVTGKILKEMGAHD